MALYLSQVLNKMLRLTISLIVFATQLCVGQNMVSGTVVDELGFPLYKAAIQIGDSDEVAYTDYEGNFTLESSKEFHWKVTVSSQGFEPEYYFVLSSGSMETIVLKFDVDIEELISSGSSSAENGGKTESPRDPDVPRF